MAPETSGLISNYENICAEARGVKAEWEGKGKEGKFAPGTRTWYFVPQETIMAIIKKIAVTGLLAAVGVVLFRFGRIVVRVLRQESASHRARRA
ncbi:MAG: hypothetical protein K0Q91_907 [Fibrobacteria bacterium]|nr:hypothetical protein [Fibrobacteria bacterium]